MTRIAIVQSMHTAPVFSLMGGRSALMPLRRTTAPRTNPASRAGDMLCYNFLANNGQTFLILQSIANVVNNGLLERRADGWHTYVILRDRSYNSITIFLGYLLARTFQNIYNFVDATVLVSQELSLPARRPQEIPRSVWSLQAWVLSPALATILLSTTTGAISNLLAVSETSSNGSVVASAVQA